ncbi:hypothetical protein [Kitasatospora sp. P5_F3]
MDSTCAIAAGVVAARTGLGQVPADGWGAVEELPGQSRELPNTIR